METVLLVVGTLLIGLVLGVFLGNMLRHDSYDGTVFLEVNEEGDDRIRWYLGMEYDDIASHDKLLFKVQNNKKNSKT